MTPVESANLRAVSKPMFARRTVSVLEERRLRLRCPCMYPLNHLRLRRRRRRGRCADQHAIGSESRLRPVRANRSDVASRSEDEKRRPSLASRCGRTRGMERWCYCEIGSSACGRVV